MIDEQERCRHGYELDYCHLCQWSDENKENKKEDHMIILGETGFVFGCSLNIGKLRASLPDDAKWKLRLRNNDFAYITVRLGSSSIATALIETPERYRFRHLQSANIRNDDRTEELLGLIDE